MIKNFIANLKSYVNYLMKVNFKELFVNVVILFCILVLAAFVYIPVGLVQELIRSFVVIFVSFTELSVKLFNWSFSFISLILAVVAFIYLFNKRFSDIEFFKQQVQGKNEKIKIVVDSEKGEELELPKSKDVK